MKTIIVKIGTESLTNFSNNQKVEKMVRDIAQLMRERIGVILVSSGAVGFGRRLLPKDVTSKQVLASVGQSILMAGYARKFRRHNITTAQVLATHATLEDIESHRAQFVMTVRDILEAGILPIINENDALSTAEMQALGRGADNDQNALLVARYLTASEIVLITNTDGVYADKDDKRSRIDTLRGDTITDAWIDTTCGQKSTTGTGGMQSKLRIGREFSKIGGITHICNGLTTGILEHVTTWNIQGGTRIIP